MDASTGTPTDLNYSSSTPKAFISNTIFAGNNTQFTYSASVSAPTGWSTTLLTDYINRSGGGNSVLANTSDVGLTAAFKYDNTVDFNPNTGSPAAMGGDFTNSKVSGGFFTPTTFRGAAGVGDTWWKTWTRFS